MEYKHVCEDGHIQVAWNEDIECPICSEEKEKIDRFRESLNRSMDAMNSLGKKEPLWEDSRNGEKIETTDQISSRLATETLESYFKMFKPAPANGLTLLEMMIYGIILSALMKAEEKKYFKPDQQASYILGYLSSKIPFDKMTFKFEDKK
jgi:hypothetical protein